MPEKRSTSIRLRDARDLYLLVGECRALGSDGAAWRRHLVTKSRELFRAEMCYFADNEYVGQRGSPQGWIRPVSLVDDWETDHCRARFWQYVRRGRLEDNPMSALFTQGRPGIRVATRRQLVADDQWYASPFCRDYLIPAGYDDFLVGVINGTDRFVQKLFVHRRTDRDCFTRRDAHMLRALLLEIDTRQPHELRAVDDSVLTTLPRRMLQVLACLLAGNTVKETAHLLDLSAHTVQEHVKRLYKRSDTSNRAELAECYRDIAPLVMGMSPEEFPDHIQQVQAATRKPWPAGTAQAENE